MIKEVDLSVLDDSGEIQFSIQSYAEFPSEEQDAIGDAVQLIFNCRYLIEACTDRIQSELRLLELTAKDDNTKELAGQLAARIEKLADEFLWKLTEGGGDWQDYSIIGIIDWFAKDGKETLLVPHLRESFKSVVEKEYTEEMFQEHLEHIRRQFYLSENFQ